MNEQMEVSGSRLQRNIYKKIINIYITGKTLKTTCNSAETQLKKKTANAEKL